MPGVLCVIGSGGESLYIVQSSQWEGGCKKQKYCRLVEGQ